jgi:DNA-binding response OmpR family regulator
MLIEDDACLRDTMLNLLNKYGYIGVSLDDYKSVKEQVERIKPELILMDINLPYYDGFYFIRLIRRVSKVPIMIISARNTTGDQILGLELGADEYLLKPFDSEIFLAKVKSLIRRVYGELSEEGSKLIDFKGLSLDQDSFNAAYNGEVVFLSRNEFKILKRLVEAKGSIVKRELLFEDIWDDKEFVDENTLTVNVTRVKAKLEQLGLLDVIKTRRGIGYVLQIEE